MLKVPCFFFFLYVFFPSFLEIFTQLKQYKQVGLGKKLSSLSLGWVKIPKKAKK